MFKENINKMIENILFLSHNTRMPRSNKYKCTHTHIKITKKNYFFLITYL